METITIEIDIEVYVKLKEIADPFVDTTPDLVIRRLLGLPKKKIEKMHGEMGSSRYHSPVTANRQGVAVGNKIVGLSSSSAAVEKLRSSSPHSHPAFLTFLMDKFQNAHGNYKTSDIVPFLETANLRTLSGSYRNPWMPAPYKTLNSCTRTIEHFRQTRKFGCWGARDTKANCDARDTCIYHRWAPENLPGYTSPETGECHGNHHQGRSPEDTVETSADQRICARASRESSYGCRRGLKRSPSSLASESSSSQRSLCGL